MYGDSISYLYGTVYFISLPLSILRTLAEVLSLLGTSGFISPLDFMNKSLYLEGSPSISIVA